MNFCGIAPNGSGARRRPRAEGSPDQRTLRDGAGVSAIKTWNFSATAAADR
jgi:hypothetical protein